MQRDDDDDCRCLFDDIGVSERSGQQPATVSFVAPFFFFFFGFVDTFDD